MTREEFKAKVSMAFADNNTWEDLLEAVWQLHLEASNQWIPVGKELPKRMNENSRFSDTVLVYNKDGYKDTAYYDFQEKIWKWMPSITHWMPLPETPRKEE